MLQVKMHSKIRKIWGLNQKMRFLKYSRNQIEKIQLKKLERIVHHSYHTVPYYHDLFTQHSITPEDIRKLSDIKKIPVTSKDDLISLDKERISSDAILPETMTEITTSGSTGEPFSFFSNSVYDNIVGLNCIRSKLHYGMKLTDKITKIGGVISNKAPSRNIFSGNFFNKTTLSSFDSNQEKLEHLNRFQPQIIQCFISQLYTFSLWLEENNKRLVYIPRFILCSGEIAHPYMLEKVSLNFNTEIFDRYANAELGVVADSCNSGRCYQIYEDTVLAEFLDLDNKTYIVGTNLDNFVTPFIRYNTGDMCTPVDPSCENDKDNKSNLLKFKNIVGRDNDFILLPDQTLLAPITLVYLMRAQYHFIKKYRFIQESRQSITIELVPHKTFDDSVKKSIISELRKLSKGLNPKVVLRNTIPPDASGKMRIIKTCIAKK